MNNYYKSYEDIINQPRPVSNHIPMNIITRASQFLPFAALPGHIEALYETSRITQEFIFLDDEEKVRINTVLQDIIANFSKIKRVCITYYVKDDRKCGGIYKTDTAPLKKIDVYNKTITLDCGTKILFNHIFNVYIYDYL